ncbi:MAG: hypothetical protein LQ343_004892 [Gyalolechia ehrenbergii]|nr:MAG: hypothetical protein LQ343_004892 [Gyalolechia ehrenbergii]
MPDVGMGHQKLCHSSSFVDSISAKPRKKVQKMDERTITNQAPPLSKRDPRQVMPLWDYLRRRRERKEAEAVLKSIIPQLREFAEGAEERIAIKRATLQRRTERYKREDEERARREGQRKDQERRTRREGVQHRGGESQRRQRERVGVRGLVSRADLGERRGGGGFDDDRREENTRRGNIHNGRRSRR